MCLVDGCRRAGPAAASRKRSAGFLKLAVAVCQEPSEEGGIHMRILMLAHELAELLRNLLDVIIVISLCVKAEPIMPQFRVEDLIRNLLRKTSTIGLKEGYVAGCKIFKDRIYGSLEIT